jgi:dolichyl-diphosphooligosaccharide--protein glycosyltransferase
MKNSLMYRLSYYRFWEKRFRLDKPAGYDTVRNTNIGLKNYPLNYFDEAFTSEAWIVRIYKRRPRSPR